MSRLTLAIATFLVVSSLASAATPSAKLEESHAIALAPAARASIRIEGDAGFLDADSGVRSGTGSANDPYVISNWSIIHTRGSGIFITNTSAHVKIENVVLGLVEGSTAARKDCVAALTLTAPCDGGRGIDLLNTSNVAIAHVRVYSETWGIRASRSTDLSITDVHIGRPRDAPILANTIGIEALWGSGLEISGVNISANTPLFIGGYSDVLVSDSRFRPGPSPTSAIHSISISNSERLVFTRNVLEGIEVALTSRSANVTFSANDFSAAERAIWTIPGVGVDDVLVCGNRVRGMTSGVGALVFRVSNRVSLSHNVIENNAKGFDFVNSNDVRVEHNLIANGTQRVGQIHGVGIEVHGNSILNTPGGLALSSVANATDNWWGDASGPGGFAGGNGTPLYWSTGAVTYSPWLTSAPTLPLACTSSPAPGVAEGDFRAEVSGSVDVKVEVRAKDAGVKYVELGFSFDDGTGDTLVLP